MGGSASSALRAWFGKKEREMNLLMLGLDCAGKTTLLYHVSRDVTTNIPTIGLNVETASLRAGNQVVAVTAWDVGGREKIRGLLRHFYSLAKSLAFVVDCNDWDRVGDAKDELTKVLTEESLIGRPLLVFANKQDLPNARSVPELAKKLDLDSVRGRAWHIQASSAKTGEGVAEGFAWLATQFGSVGSSPGLGRVAMPHKPGPPSHAETETTAADVDDVGVAADLRD
mmetsp:Transcript_132411/g.382782  ORF Transcript_132411/g.382782 Transcript_132411/m.382782 type:complete len:227 (+) Transcript_132411:73-753(+)